MKFTLRTGLMERKRLAGEGRTFVKAAIDLASLDPEAYLEYWCKSTQGLTRRPDEPILDLMARANDVGPETFRDYVRSASEGEKPKLLRGGVNLDASYYRGVAVMLHCLQAEAAQ